MFVETAVMAVLTPEALKKAKAVLSLIRKYGDRNNELADAANREVLADITLNTAQGLEELERVVGVLMEMVIRPEDWKRHSEHEKPTAGDVTARAEQFARATVQAGSHGKRRILWNAFHSSFKPDFYREGWSTHLWRIAEQVEYPECRWLADQIRLADARKSRPKDSKPTLLKAGQEDSFLAERLEELRLIRIMSIVSGTTVVVTDVGRRFKQFVWDEEMWRDEKPAG